jgi:hypothetical protein
MPDSLALASITGLRSTNAVRVSVTYPDNLTAALLPSAIQPGQQTTSNPMQGLPQSYKTAPNNSFRFMATTGRCGRALRPTSLPRTGTVISFTAVTVGVLEDHSQGCCAMLLNSAGGL